MAWPKGFRLGSGLTWNLLGLLLVVDSLPLLVKRTWSSAGGHRRDFVVGCTPAATAVTSCMVEPDRWIVPHVAIRTHFECIRWTCRVTQPVQRAPLWPASWLPSLDRSRGSKSAEVQRVWEIYDDRLQFMARLKLSVQMSLLMQVTSLVLCSCGLLRKLFLLTLIGLLVALFLLGD